jgi:DHA3 family macrolide efflux protein-like MFS transporter
MQTQTQKPSHPAGMFGFSIVWIGQIISVLASGMTEFAFTIYMYQQTHSATAMGLVQVFYITPFLIMSPIAGVMVDRYNRKLMMMISDVGGGLASLIALILFATGHLQFWHIYLISIVKGLGTTFQWPAYSAAISIMIPKEQYGRANGMMSLIEAGPGVVSPFLAGALLPLIQISGILSFDVITFAIAILALIFVFIPQPPRTSEGHEAEGNMLKQAAFGFKYIFARPSLLGLQMVFFFGNLFAGIGATVLAPMILARTSQNSVTLGLVQSAGSVGIVIGGIIMSAWGGFKKRSYGVLFGWLISAIFGNIIFGLGGSVPIWALTILMSGLFVPLINGSNQAIWQAKVAPDLQGRVFSTRRLIAWLTNPISPIIGGTLSDFLLEPAMKNPSSGLSQVFGFAFGSGSGSGMSLLIFLCGIAILIVGVAGYFVPAIRDADTALPDHDELPAAEPATAS